MTDLDYAPTIQRLGLTVGDTADDPDENPDTIWCDGGRVQIVPLNTYVKVAGGAPVPWTGGNAVIECDVSTSDYVDPTDNGHDGAGYLLFAGKPYVWVVDLTSTKVNPYVADGATHRINYIGITADGTPVDFPSVTVRLSAAGDGTTTLITASGTVPANDLTLLSPVQPGEATPIVRGQDGVGIVSAAVTDTGELEFGLTDGDTLNAGEIPGTAEAIAAAETATTAATTATTKATLATTKAGEASTSADAAATAKTDAEAAQADAESARDTILAQKGAPDGVAELDEDGKWKADQAPDYLTPSGLSAQTDAHIADPASASHQTIQGVALVNALIFGG